MTMTELEKYLSEHIDIPPGYELMEVIEAPLAGVPENREFILIFKPKSL